MPAQPHIATWIDDRARVPSDLHQRHRGRSYVRNNSTPDTQTPKAEAAALVIRGTRSRNRIARLGLAGRLGRPDVLGRRLYRHWRAVRPVRVATCRRHRR